MIRNFLTPLFRLLLALPFERISWQSLDYSRAAQTPATRKSNIRATLKGAHTIFPAIFVASKKSFEKKAFFEPRENKMILQTTVHCAAKLKKIFSLSHTHSSVSQ